MKGRQPAGEASLNSRMVLDPIPIRWSPAIDRPNVLISAMPRCACRKPRPGMFRALERELGVSVRGAPYIGDRLSDVEAAETVGARPMLVRTGTGAATEGLVAGRDVPVFDDLWAAARSLLDEKR